MMQTTDQAMEPMEFMDLSFSINGARWDGRVPVEVVLLDLLREVIGLTGTKRSCEAEVCGACTVLVDGSPISSCSFLAFEVDRRSVTTVEGLASSADLDPLQEAFVRNLGAQCGYCTPGQLMAAKALLLRDHSPTEEEVRDWMSGNICRCGCYAAIIQSIMEVSGQEMDVGR